MKKLALSIALMTATAMSATSAKPFTGFYVGGNLGYVNSNVSSKFPNASFNSTCNITGNKSSNASGFLYGIYGGYGAAINSFYIGGELYALSDKTKRNVKFPSANGSITSKQGLAIGAAARFGYVLGENLVYAKLGIESKKIETKLKFDVQNGIYSGNSASTVTLFVPGLGYERAIGNVLVRAEYSYITQKKIQFSALSNTKCVEVSIADHRLTFGAAYKF